MASLSLPPLRRVLAWAVEQGMAVRRGARCELGSNDAIGASAVVDDDLLFQSPAHFPCQEARDDVVAA